MEDIQNVEFLNDQQLDLGRKPFHTFPVDS
jgi:hypothetical protein